MDKSYITSMNGRIHEWTAFGPFPSSFFYRMDKSYNMGMNGLFPLQR